jgi:hypothetical protein
MSTPPALMISTMFCPLPSLGSKCLRTSVHGIPLRRNTSAVPAVASTSNPRSASRLTGNTIARLSRLATETNTRPEVGSEP